MAWWALPAVMGGMGILQGKQDEKQAREQMKLNAMQQRFAPLFGQAPGAAQVGPQGGALKGGLAGALGGLQTQMNYDMMKNAMAKAGSSPNMYGSTGNDVAMNMQQDPYQSAGVFIGNPRDPTGGNTYG